MLAQLVADPRLQDRHVPFRVQPPAMNDAHAAVAMARRIEETSERGIGFRGGLSVEIHPRGGLDVAAFQPAERALIDAGYGEVTVRAFFEILPH